METEIIIPDKLYFKIGEVTAITGLAGYVLRFWESEFKTIRPARSESGQRLYRRKDLDEILKIKHLLYEKKFTIPGAKKYLRATTKNQAMHPAPPDIEEICKELRTIRSLLE
jgi:DNA-binding transcriptional MerR regulator